MSPRKALNLIDRLPRASQMRQAAADDEELAEVQAQHWAEQSATEDEGVPLSDWTLEAEMLTIIADVLYQYTSLFIQANGGKAQKPPKLPRPKLAIDRIKDELNRKGYDELVALLEGTSPAAATQSDAAEPQSPPLL